MPVRPSMQREELQQQVIPRPSITSHPPAGATITGMTPTSLKSVSTVNRHQSSEPHGKEPQF